MSDFKGFSAPTHVQVPHEFFDIILADESDLPKNKRLTKSEIKLLAFMIRMTFGWHHVGFSMQFSFSDIVQYLNMGRKETNLAIQRCLEKGYIERKLMPNGKYYYRLKLREEDQKPWAYVFDWKSKMPKPEDEGISGSETEPEVVPKRNQKWFRNGTRSGSETEPTHSKEAQANQEIEDDLNKNIKENMKENINISQSVEMSETIEQFIEIHGLTDRRTEIALVYQVCKNHKHFSDTLFISTLLKSIKKSKNFMQYFLKAMHTNLTEIEISKTEVTKQDNDNVPDYIRHQLERDKHLYEQNDNAQKVDLEELRRMIEEFESA